MSKPRIVIRAFTCRRDVASAALLAKLLEHHGCEVLVVSVRDFERTLRYWKPEVAVVNTPGLSRFVKSVNPEIKTTFLEGEGFLPDETSHAETFLHDPELFRMIDLLLLWGETVSGEIKRALPSENLSKVHVVGNPAFDLIRYRSKTPVDVSEVKSIGVIMRYHNINDRDGVPMIRRLLNPGNLERVIIQCQSFVGIMKSIQALLEHTDYNITIRPHPLEQLESYQQYKDNWFGKEHSDRVKIDTSISFPAWAAQQYLILSPTSTSLLEAYLLKVPVVNIDALSKTDEFNKSHTTVGEEWQAAGFSPKNVEQLVDLVKNDRPKVVRNEKIEQQLIEYCNYDKERSACFEAALHISTLAKGTAKPSGFRMPTSMVDVIDEVSFRNACRHNALHPNMNFRRGYHKLPRDIDVIAQNILRNQQQV